MVKRVVLTTHARERLRLRHIRESWAAETALKPEWVAAEFRHAGAERRFRGIPEFGGRTLRVVCVETADTIRVITVTWDRRARREP